MRKERNHPDTPQRGRLNHGRIGVLTHPEYAPGITEKTQRPQEVPKHPEEGGGHESVTVETADGKGKNENEGQILNQGKAHGKRQRDVAEGALPPVDEQRLKAGKEDYQGDSPAVSNLSEGQIKGGGGEPGQKGQPFEHQKIR